LDFGHFWKSPIFKPSLILHHHVCAKMLAIIDLKRETKRESSIMPVLNDNKCYAEQPKRPAITVPDDLRVDWFADFQALLATQLKLNNTEKNRDFYDHEAEQNVLGTEKESFINEFNRHAGSKSTYSLKSQLLDSLRKLYCIYTHENTNADQQFLIASRIHEDITQCSPGFTDRVNFLLTLFEMPQNLDELLAKARFHLVDNIARTFAQKNAQGVHVHSRFFVIAEGFGYGVSAINEKDLYLHTGSSDKSDNDIEQVLAEGFKNRFGLFGMVNALREQIENVMTTQGYNGRNEKGYEGGVYFKLIELVKHFIAIEDDTELVEMDLNGKVVDINWQRIRLALVKRLTEEGYVALSPEEATLWVSLPESLDSTALNSLVPDGHELAPCLEFFSEWKIEQKAALVMAYLKNRISKDQEAILAILNDQAPQLTMQLKTQPDLQQIYYAIAIQKGEVNAVKTHIEKGADINAALGLLFNGDHKSDTLYWLHDNKALIAAIHADGMKAIILNGKYKGKTIAEALVSTKKGRQLLLENPDLQKLVPSNDWLYQAQEDQKKVVNVTEGFFKKPDPMATQLGQYIVYGDMAKAEELLKANPACLEKLLTEKVTVKDYSMRKCKGTVLQLALSTMDDEMCEMLAKYMNKDEITRQYQAVFPEGHEKYYAEQKPFDFSAIVDAISQGSNADVEKALDLELPNPTALWSKLEQFRANFTKHSKAETGFNPQHLIKAFELYNHKFDSWDWNRRDLFWRQVIGYTQRFLPANMAMVFAYSLYDVVDNQKKAPRSFKFRYG
ncbi:MAG TPA: hypothetical protein VND43_04555, partial [Burkholderiales bacterium]|nr:hypothetical protein [Burkholderiales bacterium]